MKKSQKNPECIRMKKAVLLLVITALFAAGIVSPAVSAAGTADGKEIQNGDYVLIGETGLNFSKFAEGSYKWMVADGSGNIKFGIESIIVDIPTNLVTGLSYYQAADSQASVGQKYCNVENAKDERFSFQFVDKDGNKLTSITTLINKAPEIYLQGKPGYSYDVITSDGTKRYSISRKPDSNGDFKIKIDIPALNTAQTYIINAKPVNDFWKEEEISLSIRVEAKTMNIKMSVEIPADAKAGIFATGDIITLKGSIENFKSAEPAINDVYLYITGRNLNANGVNLETKQPVVDGQEVTFTATEYDPEKGTWEYKWENTGLFEPGTYTIYAVTQTKGQLSARDIGITPASTELYLSDKSIHVKFAEENGGTFTQGDVVYSYWSARGSPDKVRWYIIGPNFLETGLEEKFSLYTADQKKGENAPQGVWGFVYDRYFSETMDPGNYYLVYQHPGHNGELDVFPEGVVNGAFSSLKTTFGESASLAGRPSSNCAEALRTLIDDSLCDDLCIIADLTIEAPWISVDQVEHIEIGDKLKIKGKTNYAGEGTPVDGSLVENTFSLRIERLNFDITEENSAMQLATVARVVPENIIPYAGERTYEFAEIDTSTWFAGTYMATVTNIDTGFSESITFTVGGEGVEQDSTTLQVPSDPLEAPDTSLEPLPPIIDYSEPVEPEEPKSPGFLLAPLALAAAFILRRK